MDMDPRTSTLQGKVAIITGGSRGIGRAIAIKLAEAGAHVVIHYRQNDDAAEAVIQHCSAFGVKAIAVKGNIGDETDVKHLFMCATQIGLPSILVNNAGISFHGLLMDMSLDEWNVTMQTNLSSVFLCCREAIPYLRRSGWGRIINISSIHGVQGAACEAAYAATKGGVDALTKSLAHELASQNITVNSIAPGVIDTDMMASFGDEDRKLLMDQTPLGRFGTPSDVANVVKFLASEEAAFITGQVISPNGGLMT